MGTWFDDNFKQRQAVAIDASATGDGTVLPRDIQITIPSDWDLFWENIRSDMYDVIAVDPDGNFLDFGRGSGANYSNRTLVIEVDGYNLTTLSIPMIYIYFQNPDQSSDPTKAVTISSAINGYIDLSRPSGLLVSQPLQRPPTSEPQTAFVKASTDEIDVYFAVSNLFTSRANPYNLRLGLEDIDHIKVQSLDNTGTNDTARYDITKTRFIDGFVRVRSTGGSDSTDYALVCRVITTQEQQIDIRCLIQVRDQLPS